MISGRVLKHDSTDFAQFQAAFGDISKTLVFEMLTGDARPLSGLPMHHFDWFSELNSDANHNTDHVDLLSLVAREVGGVAQAS